MTIDEIKKKYQANAAPNAKIASKKSAQKALDRLYSAFMNAKNALNTYNQDLNKQGLFNSNVSIDTVLRNLKVERATNL